MHAARLSEATGGTNGRKLQNGKFIERWDNDLDSSDNSRSFVGNRLYNRSFRSRDPFAAPGGFHCIRSKGLKQSEVSLDAGSRV